MRCSWIFWGFENIDISFIMWPHLFKEKIAPCCAQKMALSSFTKTSCHMSGNIFSSELPLAPSLEAVGLVTGCCAVLPHSSVHFYRELRRYMFSLSNDSIFSRTVSTISNKDSAIISWKRSFHMIAKFLFTLLSPVLVFINYNLFCTCDISLSNYYSTYICEQTAFSQPFHWSNDSLEIKGRNVIVKMRPLERMG